MFTIFESAPKSKSYPTFTASLHQYTSNTPPPQDSKPRLVVLRIANSDDAEETIRSPLIYVGVLINM